MTEGSGDHIVGWWVGNGASAGLVVSTLLGWLPALAAVIAFIWYCIQIYESPTTQNYLKNRRTKRIAALKAKLLKMEAGDIIKTVREE